MSAHAVKFDSTHPGSPTFYPPHQTAVLLLDFHIFIVDISPRFKVAARRCGELIDWAHERGIPIVHGLVDLESGTAPPQHKNAAAFDKYRAQFANNDEALEDHATRPTQDELNEGKDVVFYRPMGTVSALKSKKLVQWLESKGIKSVIIAGLSTSGCVVNTAKASADEGYVVTVMEDGCSTPQEEDHAFCLKLMRNQCHILSFDQIEAAFETGTLP